MPPRGGVAGTVAVRVLPADRVRAPVQGVSAPSPVAMPGGQAPCSIQARNPWVPRSTGRGLVHKQHTGRGRPRLPGAPSKTGGGGGRPARPASDLQAPGNRDGAGPTGHGPIGPVMEPPPQARDRANRYGSSPWRHPQVQPLNLAGPQVRQRFGSAFRMGYGMPSEEAGARTGDSV